MPRTKTAIGTTSITRKHALLTKDCIIVFKYFKSLVHAAIKIVHGSKIRSMRKPIELRKIFSDEYIIDMKNKLTKYDKLF